MGRMRLVIRRQIELLLSATPVRLRRGCAMKFRRNHARAARLRSGDADKRDDSDRWNLIIILEIYDSLERALVCTGNRRL